ncbi:MAG: cysteine peptidase family C39 domain-containing protein [Actinomycetota bacterium]|nr:cysteine peptidase family C39 domain-containing protein [Actinomycetota bacterium]
MPFLSQRQAIASADSATELPAGVSWGDRSCAIACATMVLNHFGRRVTLDEVLDRALAAGAFDPARGWRHTGLVEVLQSFGMTAYRRNWRLLQGREAAYLGGRPLTASAREELEIVAAQMLEEGVGTIERLLAASVPVTVSIHRPWGDRTSLGHQVVLLALDERSVSLHDPAADDGAAARYDRDALFGNWKGTAIVAHPPGFAQPQ